MTDAAPLTCWIVTDGRRGIENQALGLAEAVARRRPLIISRRVAPRLEGWLGALAAWARTPKLEDLHIADGEEAGGAPDLWIGCGRASLPYSERARSWFEGAVIVQVQHPRRPLAAFDLVIPPEHDGLDGPNVFPIVGSPNRMSAERLDAGRTAFEAAPSAPPAPRAAVLIGGNSRRHRLSPAALERLIAALDRARGDGWSLLISTSRRTPAFAVEALKERYGAAASVWLWTDERDGPNPYDAFLAAADVVLATKDSTNMITEAASAGKPVLLLEMEGRDGKLAALYAALERRGLAKPFAGAIEAWPVTPLRETERAADEIVRRLEALASRAR